MSIRALRAAYAAGSRTPLEVAHAVLERLDAGPGPAWISLVPRDVLLARARTVLTELPLGGVPFAVKDNIDVAGLVTTAACPGFAYVARETAPAVQQLLDAGALLIGKTNLDQFATGLVGTRTPYGACASVLDPRYVSGGSSSGSAVVVADGTVCFALGTDTAGSGRIPAAFNGIVGLKPTRGVVSTRGVVPASRSLDCVSIFARDVEDAEAVFDACRGIDAAEPYARRDGTARGTDGGFPRRVGLDGTAPAPADGGSPRFRVPDGTAPAPADGSRPRLLVLDADGLGALDGAARAGWAFAVARLAALDAEVTETPFAPFAEAAELLYGGALLAERYADLEAVLAAEPDGLDPTVAEVVRRGAVVRGADVFRAQRRVAALRAHIAPLLEGVDALVLPTAPTIPTHDQVAAAPIALNRRLGTYTNFVNVLDLCALAVPVTRADDGPPFGVTFVAPAGRDQTLLALARRWSVGAGDPVSLRARRAG